MNSLENKTAFVTGGGQGIGRGIALELAKAGFNVVVADLNAGNAEAVATEIKVLGQQALALALDVTDTSSIKDAVQQTLKHFACIDIVINNAGVCPENLETDTTLADFDLCQNVNLNGVWAVSQAVIPHFKTRKAGKIINIASTAGRKGDAYVPAYCASKAGVISLTQSLAMALGSDNINVNAICPGLVKTPLTEQIWDVDSNPTCLDDYVRKQTPLGRLITPEDIGHAVVFLASSLAKNITGQALNVNGGEFMS